MLILCEGGLIKVSEALSSFAGVSFIIIKPHSFHRSSHALLSLCHRLVAVAHSFAYKMLAEIDWMSINRPLADFLGISLSHFNQLEATLFATLNFNIGVSGEDFN